MESRVLRFCQVATVQTGRKTELGNVQWITFTPDGQGFIGVVGHDGAAYCVFDKIPQTLDEHLKTRDEQSEVKMVSIGYDNSWVIVYQDGDISADEICTSLADKLRAVGSEVKVRPNSFYFAAYLSLPQVRHIIAIRRVQLGNHIRERVVPLRRPICMDIRDR
jgi:hypothetical protein